MTDKIVRFLAEARPPTPCIVLDIERVAANLAAIRAAFPGAAIYYAVKANPARAALERLTAAGCSFDAASFEEIALCLQAGAPASRISFGNTIKKAKAIAQAHEAGIDLFAFDCAEELRKIAANAPGARVFCRLAVATEGAVFPLARKFGTSPAAAAKLLVLAQSLGLDPTGVSFHVGSQQARPDAHAKAVAEAAWVFAETARHGIGLRMLDLGGGFPTRYRQEVCSIETFGETILAAIARHFPEGTPDLLVEPGRFLVGDAGIVSTEVILVSRRGETPDAPRWVYLDIGRFGGLSETEGEATHYVFRTPHDGTAEGPVIIAGPTCDSADTLYEKAEYTLPLALASGDRIEILATGAYVTTYATIGFNGFRPLTEYCI